MIETLNNCGVPIAEHSNSDCYIKLECGDYILQECGKPIKHE